jgi:hypothetical protein
MPSDRDSNEEQQDENNHGLELEIAADGDHTTHENTRTVLLVGDLNNLKDEMVRAAQLADDHWSNFLGEDGSVLFSGSRSLDNAEWRQFIEETQDDVYVAEEVPV